MKYPFNHCHTINIQRQMKNEEVSAPKRFLELKFSQSDMLAIGGIE